MGAPKGFDVVVMGAGLAGVSAALEASLSGARVALASLGDAFSGSSFYGGTWGLGLVGPLDDQDAQDFEQTILRVGCGQADPTLVRTLVAGIPPAIHWLEDAGASLRRPAEPSEQEYVPCFDHKARDWHGLVRDDVRTVLGRELLSRGVECLPRTELIDIRETEGHVSAAVLALHDKRRLCEVPCGAVVLATGGLAGLYQRRLTSPDVCASAHAIALRHGCSLVNAEFLQLMPGIVFPVWGVVLNEKAFRFSTLPFSEELLGERSGYGPFTSRLRSHAIDLAMAEAGTEGLALSYRLPRRPPELVADYFSWLGATYGLRPEDEVRVTLFAHASNGGIRILPNASCAGGPAGLFACGECAGGIHGADRIGGLASAAALVFGRIAGRAAALEAGVGHPLVRTCEALPPASGDAKATLAELRRVMDRHAMVGRTEEGLLQALCTTEALAVRLHDGMGQAGDFGQAVSTCRVESQLSTAQAMLRAMLRRRQSCGSHHRAD